MAGALQGSSAPHALSKSLIAIAVFFCVPGSGSSTLKGVTAAGAVDDIFGKRGTEPLDAAEATVDARGGPRAQVMLLRERWAESTEWLGQVVGSAARQAWQSRLARVPTERVADEGVPTADAAPFLYHTSRRFDLVIQHLQRHGWKWTRHDRPQRGWTRCTGRGRTGPPGGHSAAAGRLWSPPAPEQYLVALFLQRQKQQTQEALVAGRGRDVQQPVLARGRPAWNRSRPPGAARAAARPGPDHRLLLVLTCRGSLQPPGLFRRDRLALSLRHQVEDGRARRQEALPPEVVEQIVAKTTATAASFEGPYPGRAACGRWWEAEVHRLRGALAPAAAGAAAGGGGAWLQRALTSPTARRRVLELRAAMSLSRLWQRQGGRADAHALLAPIYGWFTEGFDTADLQEAQALLEELGG